MAHRLPVLPPGTLYLVQALGNDMLSLRQIAAEVEKFPPIAARLLALANSPWSSPVSPIRTVDHACSRLGMKVVRSVGIGLAVSQPFNPALCPRFDSARYWVSALVAADLAYKLAGTVAPADPAAARTCGLLANIGLVWMADVQPDETDHALRLAAEVPGRGVNTLLRETAEVGYDEVGAALARHWKLPQDMQHAIANQFADARDTNRQPLTAVLQGTVQMTSAADHGLPPQPGDARFAGLGLEEGTLGMLYDSAVEIRTGAAQLAEVLALR